MEYVFETCTLQHTMQYLHCYLFSFECIIEKKCVFKSECKQNFEKPNKTILKSPILQAKNIWRQYLCNIVHETFFYLVK